MATMAPSNFGYSIKEAFRHFFRNFGSSLGAVVTIFLSLFIIGIFVIGSALVNSVIGSVEDQVTINVFISDDATDEQIEAFQEKLESWDNVASVTFKTKEDALEEYSENISNNAEATMAALDGENPLPRSFVVEMDDPSLVEEMAERIKADEDYREIVEDNTPDEDDVDADVEASVLYGQEEVSRLFQITNYIQIAAVVLVIMLTFVAFVFINNTIRLSISARQREIGIMRLVGASNSFIRGPFITEGVLQSLLGSLLAIGSLELIRRFAIPVLEESIQWMSFSIPMNIYLATYLALVLLGVLIGLFGSFIAMRRYLKV